MASHAPPAEERATEPVVADRALVERMAGRDSTALNELQRRHWKRLYAMSYAAVMSADRADWVVTRVFEQAWFEAPEFRSRAAQLTVGAWLSQLCRAHASPRRRTPPGSAHDPSRETPQKE